MANPKKQKRVINKFKMIELSAVDRPAQEGAKSVIMKRAPDITIMTLADKSGHAHLLFQYDREIRSGETSYSSGTPEGSHSHPFIVKNGKLVMGEVHGHTHDIDVDDFNSMLFTEAIRENIARDLELSENSEFKSASGIEKRVWPDSICMEDGSFPIKDSDDIQKAIEVYTKKADCDSEVARHIARRARALGVELNILKQGDQISFSNAASGGGKNTEIDNMPDKDNTADVAEIQKQLDDVNAELAIAKAYGGLNDVEKVHYDSLSKGKREKFLAKSKEDRIAEMELLKSSNPVVYTSQDGVEFYKSDDARLIQMAKDRDQDRAELKKQADANEKNLLIKRAETELEFMPGTVETRVALLKAVDTIEDEVLKTAVTDSLKAKNAKMSKSFETLGSTEDDSGNDATLAKSDATDKLDTLAKKWSEEKGVDYFTAYDSVAKANPGLYAKAVGH